MAVNFRVTGNIVWAWYLMGGARWGVDPPSRFVSIVWQVITHSTKRDYNKAAPTLSFHLYYIGWPYMWAKNHVWSFSC